MFIHGIIHNCSHEHSLLPQSFPHAFAWGLYICTILLLCNRPWDLIRSNAGWIVQYHSEDDPLIPVDEARHVAKHLKTEVTASKYSIPLYDAFVTYAVYVWWLCAPISCTCIFLHVYSILKWKIVIILWTPRFLK